MRALTIPPTPTRLYVQSDDETPVYVFPSSDAMYAWLTWMNDSIEQYHLDMIPPGVELDKTQTPAFHKMKAQRGTYDVFLWFFPNGICAYHKTYDEEQYDPTHRVYYGAWVILSHDENKYPYRVIDDYRLDKFDKKRGEQTTHVLMHAPLSYEYTRRQLKPKPIPYKPL